MELLKFLSAFFIACGVVKAVIALVLYLKEREDSANG